MILLYLSKIKQNIHFLQYELLSLTRVETTENRKLLKTLDRELLYLNSSFTVFLGRTLCWPMTKISSWPCYNLEERLQFWETDSNSIWHTKCLFLHWNFIHQYYSPNLEQSPNWYKGQTTISPKIRFSHKYWIRTLSHILKLYVPLLSTQPWSTPWSVTSLIWYKWPITTSFIIRFTCKYHIRYLELLQIHQSPSFCTNRYLVHHFNHTTVRKKSEFSSHRIPNIPLLHLILTKSFQ